MYTLHMKIFVGVDIYSLSSKRQYTFLFQMGFKRRGLRIMLVILLHTYHFTGLVLSVSTDFVSMKGLKDAFKQYQEEDYNKLANSLRQGQ